MRRFLFAMSLQVEIQINTKRFASTRIDRFLMKYIDSLETNNS